MVALTYSFFSPTTPFLHPRKNEFYHPDGKNFLADDHRSFSIPLPTSFQVRKDVGDIDLQHLHRGQDAVCVTVNRRYPVRELL